LNKNSSVLAPLCKWAVLLLAAASLVGCGTMSDPVLISERVTPAKSEPTKKIMVVIDMQMEFEPEGTRLTPDRQAHVKSFSELAAKAIVEAVKKRGFNADYVVVEAAGSPIKIDATYSHIWTQTLTAAIKRTDVSSGRFNLIERKWSGYVRQLSQTNQFVPVVMYRIEYQSDGIFCFYPTLAVTNKEACQNTYINFLIAQLTKAGVQP
jgi:hypothetical protein